MRIDAHQHLWQLARGDYLWLTPAAGALYRDFAPEDILPTLEAAGIGASVLIQAAATEAETRFLLELTRRHRQFAAVVGWVDFESPEAPARMRALLRESAGKLKGLRPMVQDIEDSRWLARPSLDPAFEALIECDLSFDALVRPAQLPALLHRLSRYPALRAVLDHGGKPDVSGGALAQWAAEVRALAGLPSLHCKLSGLLTEAAPGALAAELDFVVATLFGAFGPGRILWGSDWPVVTQRASYPAWLDMAIELVRRHAPGHEHDVFARNAARFYRLAE